MSETNKERERIIANGLYVLPKLGSKRLRKLYENIGCIESILQYSKNDLMELLSEWKTIRYLHCG